MADEHAKPKETAKAAQAWADYFALGPGRSLEKLADQYLSRTESVPTKQLSRLKEWSTDHGWQERLKQLASEQTAEVVELERAILIAGTRELHRRYGKDEPLVGTKTDELLSVLSHVKPREPVGSLVGNATIVLIGVDPAAI